MLIEMDSIIVANVCTSYVMQQHKSSDHTKRYICIHYVWRCGFFFFISQQTESHFGIYTHYISTVSLCTVHAYRMYQLKPITIHADMFAFYWNDALHTTGLLPDLADARFAFRVDEEIARFNNNQQISRHFNWHRWHVAVLSLVHAQKDRKSLHLPLTLTMSFIIFRVKRGYILW